MLEDLKEKAYEANLDLVRNGLVVLTFGNASAFDREAGLMAIKPSGLAYASLRPEDMVLVDSDGRTAEGRLRPSSDAPAHLALYRAFAGIGGVCHVHSPAASAFAQAGRPIPCLGTTQADYFPGPVPVTRFLRKSEVEKDYEKNTGRVIVESFARRSPHGMPAALVAGHAPFTWGRTPAEAVVHAFVLEFVARMALDTLRLNPKARPLPAHLLRKHYERKHGPKAYYGQPKEKP
ncbi:MAG: L-ribulose-5-phosphate 4-epimerase AraD [Candidatus Aminicenantes bacterium]|nr:L-ribulose-5-phosphate 4-epimerase AraD [Candidatus Aminicenantes bacterium]